MNAVLYYLALPFIYFLSYLPFRVMYWLSDVMYVTLYYVLGYRTKVVMTNLRNSFPEKSEAEIRQICRKFYRYFCDLILETLKTLTITPEEVKKHVTFEDPSIFEKYYREQQSVIIVMGHFGNWELGGARFSVEPFHQAFVIYHPLRNPYFEQLTYHMRTRLGNGLYTMKNSLRGMLRDRGKLTATAFIADQTPSYTDTYWTTFLNQDTPIFIGPEKIARRLNYPMIYISLKRPRRGLYHLEAELLVAKPAETAENEISELHTRRLEQDIREQPEIWLWTHRRWKHKRQGSVE